MQSLAALLAGVSIFRGLSKGDLEILARNLKPAQFAKDDVIVRQGSTGDSLYVIEHGRVKVVRHGDGNREIILSIFRPGDFFGEMSLLDGQPRSANVVALEDTSVLILSRPDFVQHLQTHPSTALNILADMSLRLREADEIISNLALLDVHARLAKLLTSLAHREGEPTDEGILIRHRLSHQDFADMAGTTRETVSRVLAELQRRGLLSMQGKDILLSHGFMIQGTQTPE